MRKVYRDLETCKKIEKYLRQEGVTLPPDFIEILIEKANENYGGKLPPIKSIRAVVKLCNYWKEFCANEEEFSKLVCAKTYSMVRLHAAAITSNKSDDTCYVGVLCKLKQDAKMPNEVVVTSATYGGLVKIQQKFKGIMVEL